MSNNSLPGSADIEETIQKYGPSVYRLAYARAHSKADADDIYQEVFLRYIRSTPKFDNDEHCKAWLLRVTVNCANSLLGSIWRKRRTDLDDVYSYPQPELSELDVALEKLPGKMRTVIHLHYYEGYKTTEIAAITGEKQSTVRVQLMRAREKLKDLLEDENV